MARKAEDARTFEVGQDTLRKAVRYALLRIGAVVVSQDSNDMIIARLPLSWCSFGEKTEIRLGEGGRVSAVSTSTWPLTLFDWGKNRRNVYFFFEWISDFIELYAESETRVS